MSKPIAKNGRSTIWDAKTRCKTVKKRVFAKPASIKDEIDAGYKYFWARRKVGIIRCPTFTHQ